MKFKFNMSLPIKKIILALTAALVFTLFVVFPADEDNISNILNSTIAVSGIISSVVITYLFSKLFSLKQEKEYIKNEINILSEKLTNFRKIIYYILNSDKYWNEYSEIQRFKLQNPLLEYQIDSRKENSVQRVLFDETNVSHVSIILYYVMEKISRRTLNIDWVYDVNIVHDYSLNYLYDIYDPISQLHYFLKQRYVRHTEGLINDKFINPLYKDNLIMCISKIDIKYNNYEFDRKLVAEISDDFYTMHLPKLINLTKEYQNEPKTIKLLFNNMIIIFIIGVLVPMILQCVDLYVFPELTSILTLIIVGIQIILFVNFMFALYSTINEEIRNEKTN